MAGSIAAAATAGTAWILSLMDGAPGWLQNPLSQSGRTDYPHQLASLLSPAAKVHLPGSAGFEQAEAYYVPTCSTGAQEISPCLAIPKAHCKPADMYVSL